MRSAGKRVKGSNDKTDRRSRQGPDKTTSQDKMGVGKAKGKSEKGKDDRNEDTMQEVQKEETERQRTEQDEMRRGDKRGPSGEMHQNSRGHKRLRGRHGRSTLYSLTQITITIYF